MFKTFALFFSCQMAYAVANQQTGLTHGSRNLQSGGLSNDCINGTVKLNLNETVIESLKPFYVNFFDIIKDPNDVSECNFDYDIKNGKLDVSCSWDFSSMTEEHATAKRACEGAGGKIFLFDLSFNESGKLGFLEFSLSLDIAEFPLCVDEDCDIDGISAKEEEDRNAGTTMDSQARVTPTCVEDGATKFVKKVKKNKKGEKKAIKKKCDWLAKKNKKKQKKFCSKTNSFKGFEPARNSCFKTCCAFRD